MANYWEDSAWIVKVVQAELSVRPLLTRRRWTDKDVIVANAVYWPEWPIIPAGEKFAGERALRVFFKVEDFSKPEADPTRIVMKPPDDAILVSTISVEDARQADIVDETNNDASLIPVLVVPVKFFVWVAGALSFDKKVLLSLTQPIMEHCLEHDDADIWPEIVWISPLKADDRKYYYSVLPLVGMGGVIDPQRGNPGLYAALQADPYRHVVWDVVDEVIDSGTSAWGQGATSGDGAATIFAIKLRLVNFLRDLADVYQEEEFELMILRGGFGRGEVEKAISNGFGKHLSDDQRRALWAKWLERADIEDGLKPAVRAMRASRLFGHGQALTQILRHAGQGWTNPQEWGDLLVTLAWRAECLSGAAELKRMARTPGVEPDDIRDAARKLYMAGKISWREAVKFGGIAGKPDPYGDKKLYEGIAAELEVELKGVPGRPGVLAKHGLYFAEVGEEEDDE